MAGNDISKLIQGIKQEIKRILASSSLNVSVGKLNELTYVLLFVFPILSDCCDFFFNLPVFYTSTKVRIWSRVRMKINLHYSRS